MLIRRIQSLLPLDFLLKLALLKLYYLILKAAAILLAELHRGWVFSGVTDHLKIKTLDLT